MKHVPSLLLVMTVFASTCLVSSCGKKKPSGGSPESIAMAFAEAMASGDTEKAAEFWNYTSEARRSNPDWDDIPSGQRGQIVSKLKSAKQSELESQKGYFASGMEVESVSASGSSATVKLSGGQGTVAIRLEQADGKWGVVGFSSASTLQ